MPTTEQGQTTPSPLSHANLSRAYDVSRLGELLVRRSLITAEQLAAAGAYQKRHGGQFAATLVKLGFVTDDDLTSYLHKEYRLPVIDPLSVEPLPEVLTLIPHPLARKHEVLPISLSGSTLTLAMADPSNLRSAQRVQVSHGLRHPHRARAGARESRRRSSATTTRETRRTTTRSPISTASAVSRSYGRRHARPRRASEGDGGSAARQARQRADDRRGRAPGERHPHRALRERPEDPLPDRRRPLRHHAAAAPLQGGARVAHQDHGLARHLRAASAAGRGDQGAARRPAGR